MLWTYIFLHDSISSIYARENIFRTSIYNHMNNLDVILYLLTYAFEYIIELRKLRYSYILLWLEEILPESG